MSSQQIVPTEHGSGRMLRFFVLPTPDGEAIDVARYRRQSNLVIFFGHGAACTACQRIIRDLIASHELLHREHGKLIVVTESTHPVPASSDSPIMLIDPQKSAAALQQIDNPALLVADKYGEVYILWKGGEEHAIPDAADVANWLLYVDTLCDECTTSQWDQAHQFDSSSNG